MRVPICPCIQAADTPSSAVIDQLASGGAAPFMIGAFLLVAFVGMVLRFLRRGGNSL